MSLLQIVHFQKSEKYLLTLLPGTLTVTWNSILVILIQIQFNEIKFYSLCFLCQFFPLFCSEIEELNIV